VKRKSIVVALCVTLFVTAGFAATKKFQRNNGRSGSSPSPLNPGTPDNWGGGTGNWSTGPWSAGVPGATSDVTIYSGGSDLVTLDVGSTTIESLTLGGINNGFTSELTDGGTAQTLTITNGMTIGATGFLNLTGASTFTAATMSNGGQVYIGSGATINLTSQASGITDVPLNSSWQVYGNFELGGVANTGFANLTTVEGTVDLENGQSWTVNPGGGMLINSLGAIVNVGGGSTLTIMGDVMNSGGIYTTFFGTVTGNTLMISGTLTNQAGATFELLGSGSCGMPNCGDTAKIGVNLTNYGYVNVEGVSTLAVSGAVDNSGYIYTNADLVAGGNTITINGMLTNEMGGQFVLNGNGGFSGPGDMATVGSVSNSGTVDVEGGSTLTVNGAFDNSGTLVTNLNGNGGGNMVTVGGLLTNEATGQITLNGGMSGDVLQALAGLSNGGIITVGLGSTLIVGTGVASGPGYIQLANGTLTEIINGYGPLCGVNGNCGLINVTGSALLMSGMLDVILKAGFNPVAGSEFTILTTTGMITGMFSNPMEFDCFNGGTECWEVAVDPTGTMLELTAVNNNGGQLPEPATLLVLIPGLLGMGYGLRRKLFA
jgi:hypothetical protein